MDNTTAMACINHMGTNHSLSCNQITHAIWNWCISNKIWISAAHIPGRENVVADHESRRVNLDAEWKLDSSLLQTALSELERSPTIDLFASRLNAQLPRYVFFRPDLIAVGIDAFSLCWKDETFYAFPPFSIIAQVLQKVQQDQGTGILVVPDWPTQVWYPVIHCLLLSPPVRLPRRARLLRLPSQPEAVHPSFRDGTCPSWFARYQADLPAVRIDWRLCRTVDEFLEANNDKSLQHIHKKVARLCK